jgi:hypothetical protein
MQQQTARKERFMPIGFVFVFVAPPWTIFFGKRCSQCLNNYNLTLNDRNIRQAFFNFGIILGIPLQG